MRKFLYRKSPDCKFPIFNSFHQTLFTLSTIGKLISDHFSYVNSKKFKFRGEKCCTKPLEGDLGNIQIQWSDTQWTAINLINLNVPWNRPGFLSDDINFFKLRKSENIEMKWWCAGVLMGRVFIYTKNLYTKNNFNCFAVHC